ncbi:MAG: hypothetical protein IID40_07415 [Planctomycetes bacterium]|nr:hypothetical protein [Planctomycetota bacterium]
MGRILDALHALQEIETELGRLRRGENDRTRLVQSAERQIRRTNEKLSQFESERAATQLEVDRYDTQVKSRDETICKHREALLTARTNKDYAAILTSINTEKADSAKVEKLALEKLAEFERIAEQVASFAEEKSKFDARLAKAKQAAQDYLDETHQEREELLGRRREASEGLPPTALATFTRVAEKHDGEGLAEVVRLHPKREEYACGGCNMTVPLDHVNALAARDEIQYCLVCGRILYLLSTAEKRA